MAGTLVPSHGRSGNAKRALLQGVGVFKQRQVARRRAVSLVEIVVRVQNRCKVACEEEETVRVLTTTCPRRVKWRSLQPLGVECTKKSKEIQRREIRHPSIF